MPEDLLDAAQTDAPARPDSVPEKFWDAANGTLRTDALLKSYLELERRLSQRVAPPGADAAPDDVQRFRCAMGVPETPEGYDIQSPHELCCADPAINARLHGAGFTPDQAQLVYDLAAERLLPLVGEVAQHLESERELDRLRAHFGGEDRFKRIASQLSAWGGANLPPQVFEALSSSYDGVVALAKLAMKSEPDIAREADAPAPADETALRAMMRDPRYWRSREPEFVRRVTDGFRRLVGG